MPIQSPYRYKDSQEDEQDPYRRQSPDGAIVEPMQEDGAPIQDKAPTATEPSQREEADRPVVAPQAPAPAPTFKQMQDAGQARPPMPPHMLAGSSGLLQRQMLGGGPEAIEPETGLPPKKPGMFPPAIVEPEVQFPGIIGGGPQSLPPGFPPPTLPPSIIEPEVQFPAVVPELPVIEPSRVEDIPAPIGGDGDIDGQDVDAIVEPTNPTLGVLDGGVDDTGGEPTQPNSSLDLLSLMLTGLQEPGDLRSAVEQSALDRVKNPSPYNADVVKNLYGDLAAGIDDQFAQDERALGERMAARGLFGSAGKDFHSGRLSDLNVGRRSAKTALASDLAREFAQSYGDYQGDSVNQGLNVSGANDARTLDYLRNIMDFGQQGFENDLAVEQFNANQNADYQRLLEMMLAAGYGA